MLQLQIEVTSFCNARCVFCIQPGMRRKRGRMEQDVYRKIVAGATEVEGIEYVFLQGLGEPLMDPELPGKVWLARKAFPEANITVYTNGSLLTAEMVARLKGAGLSGLMVSLNSSDPEQREAIMGLRDYDRVVAQVEHARKVLPVQVQRVFSRDLVEGQGLEFRDRWGEDAKQIFEGNWAGEAWRYRGAPQRVACGRALGQLMFLWDGTMALCCFDGEGHMTFGNVRDKTVRELWESPERAEVREMHRAGRRGEIGLCRGCSTI